MKAEHEVLEDHLKEYEEKLRGLNSYLKELKYRAGEHGTEKEHIDEDLMEAENNIKYYECEIVRIRELIGNQPEGAAYKEPEGVTYFVYQDEAGEWRWQLRAANHRIIADSGEGYHNRRDCLHGITLVKDSKNAPVKEKQ
jgi:uncharacterized protein YegP (UPF0339 family)